ncbi:MAG: geranylgeranyl pyrophosphate synthase [Thermoplasmatales archaeon SG8-52-3]|nr:MAG: geranylgeranyl pyrophosphate synthase [Thermoplasmatales archaeon SG8-52-3]
MDIDFELKKRADFFNTQLEKFLEGGNPESLYNAARHLPLAGGKRLRPCFSLISCEAVKGDIIKVIPLAISLELIHNFTLIHDDIMDKSNLRRNFPTVHVKYGEPSAINAGDLLFIKAFESMHNISIDCPSFKNVEFGFIDFIKEICEGQQLDMDYENRKIINVEEYIEMIRKKTAVFFQYAAEAGAIVGGGTKEEINALNEYGLNAGLGFQIWDDYLDISSDEETLGKDIGNDIRNGKKTLIAVHCLNNANGEDKIFLDSIFGNINATEDEVKQVFDLFKKLRSIDYAKNTALNYITKAKNALDKIPDSDAKQLLIELADYSIKREN